jgi:hypothetical protein
MELLTLLASASGVAAVSKRPFLLLASPCSVSTTARVAIWQAKTLITVGRTLALEEFKSALESWR